MKKLLLFTFFSCLLLISHSTLAQQWGGGGKRGPQGPSITGKVSGTLVDAETGEPVPFASVVLHNIATDKDQNGTLTEQDGSFKLSEVPNGKYQLLISFVGYDKLEQEIEVTLKSPDVSLGTLQFTPGVQALDEVVVEGEKEIIENKIDRIVYNAETDVANTGGNAADVLRRTPLLSVDLEGNVSLRGNNNVQILINGKPSTMFASNPGEALNSIPSDQIKSVEVITSPSAKYDGEGSAGIINIITKKKSIEGVTGNADLSVGTRQNNGSVGLNVSKGRFGFNLGGNSYYSWPRNGTSYLYREEDVAGGEQRIFLESGTNRGDRLGFFGNVGAFYDFNAFNSLVVNGRLRGFSSDRTASVTGSFDDPTAGINQDYLRNDSNESLFSGYELSFDFVHKFPGQKDRELITAYKVDGNIQNRDNFILQEDLEGNDPALFRDERNFNDGDNTEQTIQLDYVHPISDKVKLETGGKGVLRDVSSDYLYEFFDLTAGEFVTDVNRTDIFKYDQDVLAGYISTTAEITDKWGLIAGVRYEYTSIAGDFNSDNNLAFSNDYDNWLPSVTLSRKLKNYQSMKLSYNKRIQRPSLFYINPYRDISNARNISFGNPDLEPEITQQTELTFTFFIKKVMLNTSVFYRHTGDIIESFLTVDDDGVSLTTYQNIGTNNSVGTNVFSSATLFKVWTLRGGFNLYTYDASGTINGVSLSRTALLFSGNINSSVKLGKDWTIDLFGFYRAPRQSLQGTNPSFSIMGMGLKKNLWEKRGYIGLRIIEPFFENKSFGSELQGTGFYQESDYTIAFRSFGINFGYRFGKLGDKSKERKSRIRNNDLKGDDDQGQGF